MQPLIFQFAIRGAGGLRSRDCHDPKVSWQIRLMFTDDLAQPSSDSIANNRRADAFRRDESGTKRISIHSTGAPTTAGRQDRFWGRKHAQDEGSSALRAAFLFHPLKLGRSREPSRLGKGRPLAACFILHAIHSFWRGRRCRPMGSQRLPDNVSARRTKLPPAKLRRRNKNRYR